MAMPMVQIGPVFMSVFLGVVFVPVHMAHLGPKFVMLVVVMESIMPMEVLM